MKKYIHIFLALMLCLFVALTLVPGKAISGEEAPPAGGENEGGQAPEDDLGERGAMESKIAAKINEAVKKGCEWVKKKQQPDGSWISSSGTEGSFKCGTTALGLFALLKGGVDRREPCIAKGFDYLHKNLNLGVAAGQQGAAKTYDVSVTVLALEALYAMATPSKKKDDKKAGGTEAIPDPDRGRKNFRKFAGADRAWMKSLIDWLIANQEKDSVWRYPGPAQDGNPFDASNTQYAMLALNAGRRLGFPIPTENWIRVVDYFLQYQDADGPEVRPFPVPAADFPIAKLKSMEKKHIKELKKAARRRDKEEGGIGTTAVNPYEEYGKELKKMKARGWSYVPKGKAPKYPSFETTCGSMTTSGVAALVICKAALERYPIFRKKYQKAVDQSIRDGCAWLAHNFTVTSNPGRGGYHYYFLYGMERAGVLSMCNIFGDHNWYDKGSEFLVGQQQASGAWPVDGHTSDYVDTCFAILFLCKATTPIVNLPEFAETGAGILEGGDKKKGDKEKK